jgi:putative transferase (TIGR04331 family)
VTRLLITTADERSWMRDRPVLFLGEWCRRFDRASAWAGLDAVVAPPFGISEPERSAGIAAVRRAAAALLPELAAALNRVHGVEQSTRAWEIILGHWLIRCVATVFNRYGTVVQALRSGCADHSIVFDAPEYQLATTDSETFKWACNDDVWNHVLYAKILRDVGGLRLDVRDEPLRGLRGFGVDTDLPVAPSPGPRARLASLTSGLLPIFSRGRDALLVSTYLPLSVRLRLEVSLGQFPQVWRAPALERFAPVASLRAQTTIETAGHEGFERFLRRTLPDLIPTCYLEGFAALRTRAAALPWPQSPRFIYAANNWDTDEQFKVWTAMQVERGTVYITGQHGNNYGTHVWGGAEFWPERSTPDRFVTWGWTDRDPRNVAAFNFRVAGRAAPRMRADGGLLLVEVTLPHRTEPHDVFAEHAVYQEEQFRFVAALPERVRARLTVRLYGEFRRHPWRDAERWRAAAPDVAIEHGTAPISSLIAQSRLVVHSYDSTGILEGLALNSPLMCFWQGGMAHLLPEARPYYELLRAAGILHETPEAAAAKVAEHWEDIGAWWHSEAVQRARVTFCDRYSRSVSDPVRTLRTLLVDARRQEPPR